MKTILIATDFTATSRSALEFGIEIARQQHARLLVVHAYTLPFAVAPVPPDLAALEEREFADHVSEKLRVFCQPVDDAGNVLYTAKAIKGPVVDSVIREARESDVELIVMGTKGERDALDHLFGSSVAGVLSKAPCAVITVPFGYRIRGELDKISYATNFHPTDLGSIKSLIALARPMHAELTLLHVSEKSSEFAPELSKLHELVRQVEIETGYDRVSCALITGRDPQEKLAEYIEKGKTGMLVLSTEYRSWIGRLLRPGISEGLSIRSTVPVVVFHHRKRENVNIY